MPFKNPADRRAYIKAYQQANKERLNAISRAYYAAHKEQCNANTRAYHAAHRVHLNAISTAYYEAHKDDPILRAKKRAALSAWQKANPEKVTAANHRRRAHKANAPHNDLTAAQWREIKAHYGSRCVYCGKKMQRLTQDHIIPLSKGGSNTASNVVPACPTCNSSKGDKAPPVAVQPLLLTIEPTKKKAS